MQYFLLGLIMWLIGYVSHIYRMEQKENEARYIKRKDDLIRAKRQELEQVYRDMELTITGSQFDKYKIFMRELDRATQLQILIHELSLLKGDQIENYIILTGIAETL